MAGRLLRHKDRDVADIYEFIVDTEEEVDLLPTIDSPATGAFANLEDFNVIPVMGSTCTVGNEDGDLLVFELFSFGWKQL